jgi:hypothetical protein
MRTGGFKAKGKHSPQRRVGVKRRADSRIRTDDLIITNDLLYQLSYIGIPVFRSAKRLSSFPWVDANLRIGRLPQSYVGADKGGRIALQHGFVKR